MREEEGVRERSSQQESTTRQGNENGEIFMRERERETGEQKGKRQRVMHVCASIIPNKREASQLRGLIYIKNCLLSAASVTARY